MLFGAKSNTSVDEIPSSTLDYIGRETSHIVEYGECDLIDTHITRDGWPMSASWTFLGRWHVTVDNGEPEISHNGWTFDESEMIATCPHGLKTEIDGDTECCTSVLHEIGI